MTKGEYTKIESTAKKMYDYYEKQFYAEYIRETEEAWDKFDKLTNAAFKDYKDKRHTAHSSYLCQ